MIQEWIGRLIEGGDLSQEESHRALGQIMDGAATDAQIAGFLVALRIKGESVPEVVGAARAMRARAVKVSLPAGPLLDTCGTGGDGSGTFNISTAVAFVAAAAGVRVAKHGNRSISSQCGSADVLEELGARVDLAPEEIGGVVSRCGIGFIFAPAHHPAMRHAMGPRRELGVRTLFNLLGPLSNPAGATRQLLGVFAARWVEPLADVLRELGAERAVVVSGSGGLDEAGLEGMNRVALLRDGRVERADFLAADLGFAAAPVEALRGGDASENARIIRAIMAAEEQGPRRDVVLLNAALALLAAGAVGDLKEGTAVARRTIDSGAALDALRRFLAETGNAS
jgi:anthranilate phosphoribosyltransferase